MKNDKVTNISEKQPIDISDIMNMISGDEDDKKVPTKEKSTSAKKTSLIVITIILIACGVIFAIINQSQTTTASSYDEIQGKDAEDILNILSGE